MTSQNPLQPPFDHLDGWLYWLENTRPEHEMDLGLDRIKKAAEKLDLTKPAPFVFTVGGTNGKGSTVALLEAMLINAGYTVGVYTSPHLIRFNERVRVNGEDVADQDLADAFKKVNEGRGGDWLTYFEFAVLVAVDCFQKAKVDIAIMEVGLGGRLDGTNAIDPDVSVITTIGLDHQEWLGFSIEAIAREKAGIMRAGKPAVFGDAEVPNNIVREAVRQEAILHRRGQEFNLNTDATFWNWQGVSKTGEQFEMSDLPLPELLIDNAATAIQAVQFMPEPPAFDAIAKAVAETRLSGRCEIRQVTNSKGEEIELVLDVAHNPQAAGKLIEKLAQNPVSGKTRAVIAMYKDKDSSAVIDQLEDLVSEWLVSDFESPRALAKEELLAQLERRELSAQSAETVEQAYKAAVEASSAGDRVLVTGSFLTVAAVSA
ncbi:bifunctional tetrahydrofolate synthase/dihydrofolate synthase [Endozoicomonas sp. OPT23]|uniref:bifunctional tetrahydrofolate synthase/dihydrofolate synthase n=1 Tax=Endozoicomonas sp. OPT23 TaxID=2072845 RepID=UPI00129AA222|nr:bifunctional tetrahydrofolate synthase/dihydrofolate synthase [Endozoicomonas sp. OPT23]MRI35007.1 bifunctional tetrahydrofolate synthase/dihydrofolate synthase [Endozoicomonas sp. OPT23]